MFFKQVSSASSSSFPSAHWLPSNHHDAITVTLGTRIRVMGSMLWIVGWFEVYLTPRQKFKDFLVSLFQTMIVITFALSSSSFSPWQWAAVILSLILSFGSSVKVRIRPLVTFGLESDVHKIRARNVKSRQGTNRRQWLDNRGLGTDERMINIWVSSIHPNVAEMRIWWMCWEIRNWIWLEYNYQFYSPLSTVIKHKVVLTEIQIDRLNN